MAMAGTNRAASVAASSSRLHTTRGSACSSAPAPVTRNRPTPTTIQTRSASSPWTSSARATPAVTAATSPVTPTTVGSRSVSGAQTTANAAAAANAGAATMRCALSRPIGSTPRKAEKPSSPMVSRPSSLSSPPTRDPNHPASAATATATVNQVTEKGPGGAASDSSATWSPACRRTAPPAASTSPLRIPRSASVDSGTSVAPESAVQGRRELEAGLGGVLPGDVVDRGLGRYDEVKGARGAVHGHATVPWASRLPPSMLTTAAPSSRPGPSRTSPPRFGGPLGE